MQVDCIMAFDAFFLSAVLEEVRTRCIGARVEKIHQPARDTVIVHLRCQEGREKLLFAANPAAPRLNLTALPRRTRRSRPCSVCFFASTFWGQS